MQIGPAQTDLSYKTVWAKKTIGAGAQPIKILEMPIKCFI
jgi:hypothetical protein